MVENEGMNPERITQSIETENQADREAELAKRLTALEVHFADSYYRGEGNFSHVLYEYTPIMRRLRDRYRNVHEGEEADKKLAFATSIENEINRIYRETPDREKREELITQYVFDVYANLKKEEPTEIERMTENDTTIGVIRTESGTHENRRMEEAGFGPEEEFLAIHFPAFYESGPEKSLLTEIGASFTKLAEMIPQKYPEARGIIGESWLLSLPAAERLGFKKVKTLENQFNGNGLWSQFIDQNGNISKSRFDEFMKTGKPPYEVAVGYIPIEEFLSKYLPADRKGEITLKEINPEWKKEDAWELEKYTDETHRLRNDWKNFVEDKNLSVEEFIKTYPATVSIMTKAGCYNELLKVLSEAKSGRHNLQEMAKIMPVEAKRIEEAYTRYVKDLESKKYRDRKVLIK
ncbi:hypothetical protein M1413_01535 [Patescibacteria group bacterium]|jgi:hypothetical protein|nr:hypothetical protein [Patescibacteria group bacterium]MCL5114481.1 hypothetical protein [Patescibacteria group bacterium]